MSSGVLADATPICSALVQAALQVGTAVKSVDCTNFKRASIECTDNADDKGLVLCTTECLPPITEITPTNPGCSYAKLNLPNSDSPIKVKDIWCGPTKVAVCSGTIARSPVVCTCEAAVPESGTAN